MDIAKYLEDMKNMVNIALDEYLRPKADIPKILIEAMRYSVLAGGKRLRPILCLASGQVLGGRIETILPVACAIELIHTYSLIHDDLPAIDNDDFRRGKLSNHKMFGEDMAIAAGDCLLTYAFELISSSYTDGKVRPELALRLVQEISTAAGITGMVAGQVVDIKSTSKELDKNVLQYIHTHKTGALITASVRTGAMVAGATAQELEALTNYAKNIGLAFQIVDDLLDVVGDKKKLGKTVGKDSEQKKMTYVSVYGARKADQIARQKIAAANNSLSQFKEPDLLIQIADFIVKRQS
ncbi:MAG: polyprenyl synthetase family protein [Actinomycetota bacterium]